MNERLPSLMNMQYNTSFHPQFSSSLLSSSSSSSSSTTTTTTTTTSSSTSPSSSGYPLMQFDYNTVVSPPLTPAVSPSNSLTTDHYYHNASYSTMGDRNDTLYDSRFDVSTFNATTKSALSRAPYPQHKHACRFRFCGWSFKRYEHLKRHMLIHTGERPHTCHFPGCGKSFSRSDNFHAHYRTHTKKKPSKKCNTTKAGVTSDNRQHDKFISPASSVAANAVAAVAASQHLGSSSVYYNTNVSNNYRSEISDYYFKTAYGFHHTPSVINFDVHQQSSPISPTSSPTPSLLLLNNEQSIDSLISLSNNMYAPSPDNSTTTTNVGTKQPSTKKNTASTTSNHTNAKTHACPLSECQRQFKRFEHLKRHMKVHTLERPFSCSYPDCQKKFSRSDNLSQHTKTHQRSEKKRRRKHSQLM